MSRDILRAGLVIAGGVVLAALGLFGVEASRSRDEAPPEWRGRFPNVLLKTHDGRAVRFYDDLVRGRTVAINFMYVECEGTCPGVTSNLVEVQRALGGRVGRDVLLLSLTLQPERDTPERLSDYARRYGAGPGFVFLTGRPEALDLLRHALGFAGADAAGRELEPKQHTGILRVGNDRSQGWTACPSLSSPGQVCRLIRSLDGPTTASSPPEFPMGNPFLRAGEVPARDAMALEKLGEALDRIHMTRSSLETADFQDLLLSRMIDYLQVDGERKVALRTALLRVTADCLEAAKPIERLRRQWIDAGEDGPLVDSYRAAWQASLENRARAFRTLDAVLDATPRHRLFREHAARWIFFLESHAQQR